MVQRDHDHHWMQHCTCTSFITVTTTDMFVLGLWCMRVQAIGCGSEQEDLVESTKSAVGSGAGVVVVCANKDVEGQSAVAMQMEVEQVAAVQKAVAEHDAHARFVYTAQPLRATVAQRRSLLGYKGFGPYTSCGPLCKVDKHVTLSSVSLMLLLLTTLPSMQFQPQPFVRAVQHTRHTCAPKSLHS